MGRISELVVKISANSDGFRQQLREVNAELLRSQSTIQRQTQGFANLGAGLQSFGGALLAGVTLPLAGVATAAVKTFGDIDALKRALATIEPTAAAVEARFAKLAKAAELPGLGLEQAVRADVRLRAIGFSAADSERAILRISNALASAGGTTADLDETIRQFGQLASAASITAENIKPILERVPQAGKILREAFGTASAEELRKLGLTSQDVFETIIKGLEKLPPVSSGIRNELENLGQSSRLALAEIGKAIEPAAQSFVNFASEVVKKVPEIVSAFKLLPEPAQNAALGVAGAAFAGPIAIVAIGTVLTNLSAIAQAYGTIKTALTGVSVAAGLTSGAVLGIGGILTAAAGATFLLNQRTLEAAQSQLQLGDRLRSLTEAERDFAAEIKKSSQEFDAQGEKISLTGIKINLLTGSVTKAADSLAKKNAGLKDGAKAHTEAADAVDRHRKALEAIGPPTEAQIIAEEVQAIRVSRSREAYREKALALLEYYDLLNGLVPVAKAASNALEGVRLEIPVAKPAPPFPDASSQIEAIKRTQAESDSAYEQSKRSLDDFNKKQKTTAQIGVEAMRQIRRATREVSDGIADAIFNGKNFGDTMANIAKSIGQSLTSFVLQKLIEATGLLKGFERVLSGVIKNVAGSTAGSVAGTAAGGAASSATGAAGSAGAGGASGAASLVGAVAGVATAISSIFSNFQQAAMNKTLDIVAKHTLETKNEVANLRADEFRRKDEWFTKLDDLFTFTWLKLDEMITATRNIGTIPQASGAGVNVTVNGGLILGQNGVSQLADLLANEFRLRGLFPR
jgi:tape measure domain-containing protein